MARTDLKITKAHAACLGGANTINSVIATHEKGSDATVVDYGYYMTEDEKKARVTRSVSYLKLQKSYDDWGSESFTVIDAAISAADTFTG